MLADLTPIALLFALGWWLRRTGLARSRHAEVLLRLVVWIGLPALILAALGDVPRIGELALLPIAGACLVLSMWPLAWLSGRALALPRPRLGVVIVAPMIMNLALLYPFAVRWGGAAAVARLALLDLGNGLLTFTLVYGVAAWYGRRDAHPAAALGAILRFPPFWALTLALWLNAADWKLPHGLNTGLNAVGSVLVLLVPLALGIYFRPALTGERALWLGLGLRFGAGLALGLLLAFWLPWDELSRTMLLAAAVAPVGFNTVVFAAREGLDGELAASLASLSVPIAFAILSVLLWSRPAPG